VDEITLSGCHAKIDRAEQILKELADEWTVFLKTNPYPSRIDDRTEGWHHIYLDFSVAPWAHFSVMAGEIAHDLRSALEHIVWRQAIEHLDREPTKDEERLIEFPLTPTAKKFREAAVLKLVSEDTSALLERYQPYKRRDGIGPKSLGLLHWFNRLDKHHAMHISAAASTRFPLAAHRFLKWNPETRPLEVIPMLKPNRALVRNTEVMRLRFSPNGPDPQVSMYRAPALNISFGEVPRPLRGIDMAHVIEYVRRIVRDFASNFLP
jgi:hypothetical protein